MPETPPRQQQRPPQDQQRRPQDQRRPQEKAKTDSRGDDASSARPRRLDIPEAEIEGDKTPGLTAGEVAVVEGKDGARNLDYQWIDVWLPGGKPMYIVVTTLPDHDLAVTIEQRSWKKSYLAKGRVQTDVTPIAPIGTTGQLIARDTTTGEELTVKFVWGWITGPSLLARLIKLVKRLFTNEKS